MKASSPSIGRIFLAALSLGGFLPVMLMVAGKQMGWWDLPLFLYKMNPNVLLAFFALPFPLMAIGSSYLTVKYLLPRLMGRIVGKLPVFVASRYLFSRQNRNAINIISFISVFGITYVTAALIIVLSIFNGFQVMIEGMYTTFDPDLQVVAARGKQLPESDSLLKVIMETPGVAYASPVIREKAMLSYYDKQQMVDVKGLRADYQRINSMDSIVYEGAYDFTTETGASMAVLGGSVAWKINSKLSDRSVPMRLWTVNDAKKLLLDPGAATSDQEVFTGGYFKTRTEYDSQYILVDFRVAQKLFAMDGKVTAYEIRLDDFDQATEIDAVLQEKLGENYNVQTWYEMHEALFNVMKNEKFVGYLILTLMLLIAGVNVIGGLSMIIVEKTRDIAILKSMGASQNMIRKVFFVKAFMVGGIGGIAGISSAWCFGTLQETLGMLRIKGGETFQDLQFFPMDMAAWDFAAIFVTVFGLAILAGIFPSAKAAATDIVSSLRK